MPEGNARDGQTAAKSSGAPASRPKRRRVRKSSVSAARRAARRQIDRARAAEQKQIDRFTKGIDLFQQGEYGKAKRILRTVMNGPVVALAQRAGDYHRICEKKRQSKRPLLRTLDDRYNYAVGLVNDGKAEDALRVLKRAISLDNQAAHLHYLKAVAKVLSGDLQGAYAPLKRAIQLDSALRIHALNDADLRALAQQDRFLKLVSRR